MIDRSDRTFRRLMRLLSPRAYVYTEMVTDRAIIHGDRNRLLDFAEWEHPIVLQIGSGDPSLAAQAAEIASPREYDEVNLNVGCPSDRVRDGEFGACLMTKPRVVASIVAAMRGVADVPVTVKHRIGIGGDAEFDDLVRFVETVAEAGCRRFIVHARVALLSGLSPKENRTVPPLRPDDVYRLKERFPQLSVEFNGDIRSVADASAHLRRVDGVMIGRGAYEDPTLIARVDRLLFGSGTSPIRTRREIISTMADSADEIADPADRARMVRATIRALITIASGRDGSRPWKRALSGRRIEEGCDASIIREATRHLPKETLDEPICGD